MSSVSPSPPVYGPPVGEAGNPLELFTRWLDSARVTELNDPEAMALATASSSGMPSSRMVLLKEHGEDGFVWYTNTQSRKGDQLAANAQAALLFHWKSQRQQVRLEGHVTPVTQAEADAYFATRKRMAQIGAWASQQSRPLASRAALQDEVRSMEQRFEGQDVPRPHYWSGYRLQPLYIEFWQEQAFRLHDRVIYTRDDITKPWKHVRYFP